MMRIQSSIVSVVDRYVPIYKETAFLVVTLYI